MKKLLDVFVEDRKAACSNCVCTVDFDDPCSRCLLGKWEPKHCKEAYIVPQLKDEHAKTPTLIEMAKSAAKAVGEEIVAIKNGTTRLTHDEANQRFDVCKQCEFFIKNQSRCLKCGCYMPIKTAWRSQKCPIGKW